MHEESIVCVGTSRVLLLKRVHEFNTIWAHPKILATRMNDRYVTRFGKTLRKGSACDSCDAGFLVAQVENCQSPDFVIQKFARWLKVVQGQNANAANHITHV